MKAKKQLIETAIQDGSMDRMNTLLSAAHLLNCEANNLIEEAAEVMLKKGLLLGELKMKHNDFVRSADRYFKEFAMMVNTDKTKMNLFGDMEEFNNSFRKWAKVPADWTPKKDNSKVLND